ncbi:precorrin-8X methylmutase [Desulfosoma caldarium]|uniref:Precorrin-8X methylmutase n=1 Tax=Desulfosoma caldarium TaxID=610254 RepID=A0A3N1VM94_9BACT|nr:precorrin-8X methylmutase [Desulfosoma caldarium]ROR03179.1 precorrin-8X methylmutase [Desulfosoma caldarium]
MTLQDKAADGPRGPLVSAGQAIEDLSFRIIDAEMGPHGYPPDQWSIVRRVIHTTGDFEYARLIRIHSRAVEAGCEALRRGATIYADTRMIQVGLSSTRLQWFGNAVVVPASQPAVRDMAHRDGLTQSAAAFRHAGPNLHGAIVAVGNAPTALLETLRLMEQEHIRPALVVGVPVGFVQADTAKEALWQDQAVPSITVLGRKGGSSVAVAILHALMELAHGADAAPVR